jgi:hypothetical protein
MSIYIYVEDRRGQKVKERRLEVMLTRVLLRGLPETDDWGEDYGRSCLIQMFGPGTVYSWRTTLYVCQYLHNTLMSNLLRYMYLADFMTLHEIFFTAVRSDGYVVKIRSSDESLIVLRSIR